MTIVSLSLDTSRPSSTMPASILKKRSIDESRSSRPAKRVKNFKRQTDYHSSSEAESDEAADFQPVNLADSEGEDVSTAKTTESRAQRDSAGDEEGEEGSESLGDSDAGSDSDMSEGSTSAQTKKRKRNDPDAFATSISKILGSKLSTSKRADPVLSRSKSASTITQNQADAKLEEKAKKKLRAEKKVASERGRVRDVLGTDEVAVRGVDSHTAADVQELERRLRKTAQRGVVKLFNAVRAAQVNGEEAAREAKQQGVIGIQNREERVNEMSKKGFLDLIAGGGKKSVET